MATRRWGFTLLEMLVVIGIIALLVAIVFPAMSKARLRSQGVACLNHLREMGKAWDVYATENEETLVPARPNDPQPPAPADPDAPKPPAPNQYHVGNGIKDRPRWPAMLGPYMDTVAFNMPNAQDQRQDYDADSYVCPTEPTWRDERNYAYGYNHLFLGNARYTLNQYHHYPIKRHRIKAMSGTVVFADSLGTAAGFGTYKRGPYNNSGTAYDESGNHGYTLDAPRLTDRCDRGTGDPGSPRSAVHTRHQDRANVVFGDGHGAAMTPRELGYRQRPDGRFVDLDPDDPSGDNPSGGGSGASGSLNDPHQDDDDMRYISAQVPGSGDFANNSMFSGSGRDDDPPPVPGK